MKNILVFVLPFFMLMFGTASKAQTHTLTEGQKEFVEILKVILMDKEINNYIENNHFLFKQRGNYIFVLNKETPFDGFNYQEKYLNKILNLVSLEDIFFYDANFIEVENYNIDTGNAVIKLFFNDKVKNSSFSKEFNLIKDKTWKLIN